MRQLIFFILLYLTPFFAFATHQKAAEITYVHLNDYTYRFTLKTYTYTQSLADRPELPIYWGHGAQATLVPRQNNIVQFPKLETQENTYIVDHTFPGPGSYTIYMEDPNRNGGVVNVPNSINTPMYVETTLTISPFLAPPNNSATLLNRPIDRGCLGLPFIHNPGAIDIDGDSLSFELIHCRGANGIPISNYSYPRASDSLSLNPITGDLIWNAPMEQGEFNVAMLIHEHRRGQRIGSITRDFQITIQTCDNRLPEIQVVDKHCHYVGDSLFMTVQATDPDTNQQLTISATGAPFTTATHKASFPQTTGPSPVQSTLVWLPTMSELSPNPIPVFFRANDNGNPNLNNFKTTLIQLVAKAPTLLHVSSDFNSATLTWEAYPDTAITGYHIYRSTSPSLHIPDSCSVGASDPLYTRIATVRKTTLTYRDTLQTESDASLCYRICAYTPKGETQMSEQLCTRILSNKPRLIQCDVSHTHTSEGSIELRWNKAPDLDVDSAPERWIYVIDKAIGNGDFSSIDTINHIYDTAYTAHELNTQEYRYSFQVRVLEKDITEIGKSPKASNLYGTGLGKHQKAILNWTDLQPWDNLYYDVYRKLKHASNFDSIVRVETPYYTDTGLTNDSTYVYFIQAFGQYQTRYTDSIINRSQLFWVTPQIDTPCAPELIITQSLCDPPSNRLTWRLNDPQCDASDLIYTLEYRLKSHEDFEDIYTGYDQNFIHEDLSSTVGCYRVRATNPQGISGNYSDTTCIAESPCVPIRFPNVFTPNGDGVNDLFLSYDHRYQGLFEIRIFNQWGQEVFRSSDAHFQWDGRNAQTGKDCPEGLYFFVCKLIRAGLDIDSPDEIQGNVQIIR